MHEPSVRGSKLAIAAGLAATLGVGGAGFLLGRETAPGDHVVLLAPSAPVVDLPPQAPPPPSILGRAELIDLARLAADAATSGTDLPDKLKQADGSRFNLVLPFGCWGPVEDTRNSTAGWQIDPETDALRVFATPQSWEGEYWGLADTISGKGFWVARPWSSSSNCPARSASAAATGTDPITIPGQTLAIAQFSTDAGRWRTFQKVERQDIGEAAPAQGFRLRLQGKIATLDNGAPVTCVQPGGQEQRPICAISAKFEEVRIEDGQTGEVIATWDERSLN